MPASTEQALSSQELISFEDQYGAHNYHPLDIVIERAEGSWVYDVEGRGYLDLLSAYSAVNPGALPSRDSRRHAAAGQACHPDLARFSERPAAANWCVNCTN